MSEQTFQRALDLMDLIPEVPPFFTDDADVLGWYERWLDEMLAGRDATGFGRALPGEERDYVAIARDAASGGRSACALSGG